MHCLTQTGHRICFDQCRHPHRRCLAMLRRLGFNHYCEIAGRTSAIVVLASMASLILAATAADVLH
jgi:hypothetical protein